MPTARLQVLAAAVLFGTTGTAQALGPVAPPMAVGAARILVGGALLFAVALVLRAAPRPLWRAGAAVAVYQLAFFAAVADTGVAVGTVVAIGSGPVFAGLLSRWLLAERLSGRWAACTGLAVAGVLLLVAGGEAAAASAGGIGLALISGLGYAGYTVLAKQALRDGAKPEGVMAGAFGTGALLLAPVLPLAGTAWLATPGGLALALFLGAVPAALAYVLFSRGLDRLSAGETATLTLAEPLVAAALGVLVLGEPLTAVGALGGGLVLAGLVALAMPVRARRPAPSARAAESPA